MYYIGVDLGTSSVKVLLSDEKGHILCRKSGKYELMLKKGGLSEQNPSDWLAALINILKDLTSEFDADKIDGISFSGQMHGLVILDRDDNVIRPAILWNDNRTVEETDYLNNIIGKEKLLEYTGNIALTGFTAPKLLWIYNHERENFDRISKIMLPKDYLVYKLTGNFVSDVSDISGTLFFDVKNRRYSADMLKILHIGINQLPEIHESFEVVGNIRDDYYEICGLKGSTKVIAGGGDQAVGAVGTGTVRDGNVSVSLGTSGVVFVSSDSFSGDGSGRIHSFCHANGKYHNMGVTLSAAGSLDWWMRSILKNDDFEGSLNEIDTKIIDGVLFLPYLMGERSPINDPRAKGVFYGLTLINNRSSLTKAVLEGVGFSLYDCIKAIDKNSGIKNAMVIGGGAKSAVWLQILSDIFGIELMTANTCDGGGLGAVILAMVGCGIYRDVETACEKIIKVGKVYYPDPDRHDLYLKKYKKYKQLYCCVKELEYTE